MSSLRKRPTTTAEPAARWVIVGELAATNGDNDRALRQFREAHPELDRVAESDIRIDVICGEGASTIRLLRRGRLDDPALATSPDEVLAAA